LEEEDRLSDAIYLNDIKGYLGILRDIWGRYLHHVEDGESKQLLIVILIVN
jgi:hypothetical protein